ncbi:MAG: hypothetical protein ACKPKO_21200, partial [Candidatus Fonsibacter sp.]
AHHIVSLKPSWRHATPAHAHQTTDGSARRAYHDTPRAVCSQMRPDQRRTTHGTLINSVHQIKSQTKSKAENT